VKNNRDNLHSSVSHEHEQWSELFQSELKSHSLELYSSYWWKDYYDEIQALMTPILKSLEKPTILEAGSGSGKASIVLKGNPRRTLLDISTEALQYAKLLAKKFQAKNMNYVEGDIFDMPFKSKTFDISWNIGVIEHYTPKQALTLVSDMVEVTRSGGYVIVGVPNFRSLPIIKAKLLHTKIFKHISGYRLDTEIAYSESELLDLLESAAKAVSRKIEHSSMSYVGNPLIMESPRFLIKSVGRLLNKVAYRNKFLMLVVCKVN